MDKQAIKAILFDSDGTLFQSEYRQAKAWAEVLKDYKVAIPPEDYVLYAGKTTEQIEDLIIKKNNLKVQKGDLVKRRDEIMLQWYVENNVELMPCAREALKFFYEHPAYYVALCTNGGREEIKLKLERNQLTQYFNVIITKDDVLNPKPAPDIYLAAMQKLKVKPNECLVVEDTEHGLKAAKAAGAYCFVIPNQFANGNNFSKADKILTSLCDLIKIFND